MLSLQPGCSTWFLILERYKSEAQVEGESYHCNNPRSFKSLNTQERREEVMFEDNTQRRLLTVNFIRFLKRIIDDNGSVG